MSTFQAIILGIIQGLTEFFPVSSSAHLQLGQLALGMQDLENYILFDLVCHLGTLFAILIGFREDILLLLSKERHSLFQFLLAIFPLFLLVPIMKPIHHMFDQPQNLGLFFLLNAGILFTGMKLSSQKPSETSSFRYPWRDPLLVGVLQSFALLPGISRSGTTIAGGWLLGLNHHAAIRFSFLLAIPTVLGGVCYELLKLPFKPLNSLNIGLVPYLIGFITSFVVGGLTLQILMRLVTKQGFRYFIWYCAALGIATSVYFF